MAVHDGVVAGSRFSSRPVSLEDGWQKHLQPGPASGRPALSEGYEIVFQPDPTLYDGRFANNGWLQECPKPITELTWDNAAIMSPTTAKELGIDCGSYAHGGEHGGVETRAVVTDDGERLTVKQTQLLERCRKRKDLGEYVGPISFLPHAAVAFPESRTLAGFRGIARQRRNQRGRPAIRRDRPRRNDWKALRHVHDAVTARLAAARWPK